MKMEFSPQGGGRPFPKWQIFDFSGREKTPLAEDDASRVVRTGVIAAAVFFGLLAIFSLTVPISGAAVATGEVATSGSRILIQPLSGGLVADVLVREGQSVREGQPLVRMNGVRSAAAAKQAQAKRDGLRALQARLIAERDGRDTLIFPPDLTRRASNPVVAAALRSQTAIFHRNRAIREAERRLAETERASAEAQRAGNQRQLALLRDELARYRELYSRGYARVSQVRALERTEAQLQADTTSGAAAVARANLELANLNFTQDRAILQQLADVEEQLAQANPALQVTRFDAERDTLRAPVAGRVSSLSRAGEGTVLSPGATIMEIVPQGRALIVEALIRPEDIDDVQVGAPATLRFTSVNPRGQASFDGQVVTLSPARVSGQESSGQFRAQIMLDHPERLEQEGVELQPGLPVSVQIKTESRTLFDYLFAPLSDTMSRAFREE